ncbi:MAG: hypothetical protein RXR20_19120, partial [Paraburkholderia sp.]
REKVTLTRGVPQINIARSCHEKGMANFRNTLFQKEIFMVSTCIYRRLRAREKLGLTIFKRFKLRQFLYCLAE